MSLKIKKEDNGMSKAIGPTPHENHVYICGKRTNCEDLSSLQKLQDEMLGPLPAFPKS
jgi:hypothetical protein